MTDTEPKTAEQKMMGQIEELRDYEALFCLKALMVAGHVTPQTMYATIELAKTVKP